MSPTINPLGFKVIAIHTHDPYENTNYLKILEPNTTYYFFNNYKIDVVNKTITKSRDIADDIYHLKNLKINISAIVGKNGTGKSAILELILRVLNNLGACSGSNLINLMYIPKLKVDLYFYCDGFYKIEVDGDRLEVYGFDQSGKQLKRPEQPVRLRDYFYTIVLNNSNFAYNTFDFEDEVNWLDPLFFKNDSYQAPIVINPMRTNGNIDINRENDLLRSRLIINLVSSTQDWASDYREIAEGITAHSVKLTIKKSKRTSSLYQLKSVDGKELLDVKLKDIVVNVQPLLSELDNEFQFGLDKLMSRTYRPVRDYIVYKLVSIAVRYPSYQRFFSQEERHFLPGALSEYFMLLKHDDSHITFKLKQTLNFIKYGHLELKDKTYTLEEFGMVLNVARKKNAKNHHDLIEFIPPPVFAIDILLRPSKDKRRFIQFSKLSSGQKQAIYSVTSLIYHLVNLDSVNPNDQMLTKYHNVNIMLEEIELYSHPDMQRKYIKNLLDSLSRITFRHIKSINICFVTHSPFILSDIPESNILFLYPDGSPKDMAKDNFEKNQKFLKTFGSNIHDLLSKNFFLTDGLIGQFAQDRIQNIITQLRADGEEILEPSEALKTINLIGEAFLREKLLEMYYLKYEKEKRIKSLKDELNRLEND